MTRVCSDRFGLRLSATAVAARHYRRGIDRMLTDGPAHSFGGLQKATESDHSFAVAHAAIGLAHFALGTLDRAQGTLAIAGTLEKGATRRERQHIEILTELVSGDLDRATALGHEHLLEYPLDFLILVSLVSFVRTDLSGLLLHLGSPYGGDPLFRQLVRGRVSLSPGSANCQ